MGVQESLLWESDFSCEIRMATPRVTTVKRFFLISLDFVASVFRPPWREPFLVFGFAGHYARPNLTFKTVESILVCVDSCSAESLVWESDFSCEIRMATPRVTTV